MTVTIFVFLNCLQSAFFLVDGQRESVCAFTRKLLLINLYTYDIYTKYEILKMFIAINGYVDILEQS